MTSLQKPLRGTALLERRARTKTTKAHERTVMAEARRRDHGRCRVPGCRYRLQAIPVDVCHRQHRGMGGNATGDRTTRPTLISLCRIHHGLWDRAELRIDALTKQEFDGPVAVYARASDGWTPIGVEGRR
jgi:hypothetical protein